ncbi:shikimate kinase [Parasporobacterium paucivorans]|uniref:Multifunctional fusion protein n=1 Tax=Parasporobacterium paucivorans DSM 15970 TaxID=1122934 RepID=A0A1M6DPX0_9FIRM|nr:shikimate kinase [Parasporobacterium paucivorans]SHI75271.1 Shikimate dehydrogenase substrate binding domain-containing protein [Parasporobacterium paucivorans DSM 15970]
MKNRQHDIENFGLLGHPLGHSLSPYIHQQIMEAAKIRGEYELLDIPPDRLENEIESLTGDLDGFNVTIPYKEKIIPFLSGISNEARIFGAVNTVYHNTGYNTDSLGFASMKIPAQDCNILILGTGGASRSISHVLAGQNPSSITFMARNPQRGLDLVTEIQELYPHSAVQLVTLEQLELLVNKGMHFQLLINTTPVGMWPHAGRLPLPHDLYYNMLKSGEVRHVFDAIYNPTATRFVLMARSFGIWAYGGLGMLFEQALAAQKIWHPDTPDVWEAPATKLRLENIRISLSHFLLKQNPLKIVLTGFMGAGKTTTAERLSLLLEGELDVLDLDLVITEKEDRTISEIFSESGEAYFRNLEKEFLSTLLDQPKSMIISAGGGTILQDNIVELIHEKGGLIVLLDVEEETVLSRIASTSSRPLLAVSDVENTQDKVHRLLNERNPAYHMAADLVIDANQDVELRAKALLQAFELER